MLINCRLNPLSSCYGRFHFPYAYSPSLSSTSGGDETRKRSFVTVSHHTRTHTFVPPLTGCSILQSGDEIPLSAEQHTHH